MNPDRPRATKIPLKKMVEALAHSEISRIGKDDWKRYFSPDEIETLKRRARFIKRRLNI